MDSQAVFSLQDAPLGDFFEVFSVIAPAEMPEYQHWLHDIGFLEGESVAVLKRGISAESPLVVRIGQSSFALRQNEASYIKVEAKAISTKNDAIKTTNVAGKMA